MRNFEELVKFCRAQGIMHYDGPCFESAPQHLRITFSPDAMFPETPEISVKPVDKPADASKPPKRGRDGYTADEQLEVYGVALADTQE